MSAEALREWRWRTEVAPAMRAKIERALADNDFDDFAGIFEELLAMLDDLDAAGAADLRAAAVVAEG